MKIMLQPGNLVKCINSKASSSQNTTYKEIENRVLVVDSIESDGIMLRIEGIHYPFRADRFEKLNDDSIEALMYKMGYNKIKLT